MKMREDEMVEYIRERYDTMTQAELCAELGIGKSRFQYLQKKHGILKDPEAVRRLQRENAARARAFVSPRRTEETRRRLSESRKRLIASERVRELYGLERRTRIRLFGGGERVRKMRHRLKNKGYGVAVGSREVTIRPETERSGKMERKAEAMHFRFYGEDGRRMS